MNFHICISLNQQDPNLKDAPVIHTNLDVVQMVLQFNKVHTATDVIVHKLNSSVVRMVLQLHLDPTLLDAHVQQANMDVVRTVLTMHKDHNTMDATISQKHHKRHAAFQKIKELAVITPLNTSSIWIMVVAHDSGIAAAEV